MGGEKPALPDVPVAEIGSPPRGRGKVLAALMPENRLRITPAWAGKSENVVEICREAWDHPRVGGEKVGQNPMGLIQQGSPPRGRGKAIQKGGVANGIEDHPRVGGEKADCPAGRAEVGGSPPRGRGKVHGRRFQGVGKRITPAWAGKSSRGGYARGRPRDHPRVGGEKKSILDVQPLKLGSPPRGRGKVRVMFESLTSTRITPAWAGKSCLCFICVLPSEDHPRVGGEKKARFDDCTVFIGSPPRGRGKD